MHRMSYLGQLIPESLVPEGSPRDSKVIFRSVECAVGKDQISGVGTVLRPIGLVA